MLTSAATSTPATRWSRTVAAATAALVLATACTTTGGRTQNTTAQQASATITAGHDAATRDDAPFNRQFTHETADVDGVTMHYVTGGTGEPLVLLHGWPQSWYSWREIMPALAEKYTVYALDLPGLGDSEGAPSSYDKATLARYVHRLLVDKLGLKKINLAGHDLGAGVAFQYATQFPDEVVKYAHLDYPMPGPALSASAYRQASWHMSFHHQDGFPELLVDDDVRDYLSLFYGYVAYGGVSFGGPGAKAPFTAQQIDEYARTYQRPQVLTGGFELYRTLDQDERDNKAAKPITMPTMLLTAEGTLDFTRSTVRPLMPTITRAVEVPRAGHWLIQENPEFVTTELVTFFARGADR
ncbi:MULTISPECIES: alpha/beta fold hydrolase [unclassified Micromonospora]|uniref:alpha/beta fold hydrolase n=1 Tax=unclassified Micromonospora TaxID=2617518 RepID=UPI001C5E94FC|nr:alpha/beta hydrolase [Micromonospora sp. RL09-050-HVF-A]MBW4700453.1 alpha/beta hydrolase [Micromonospora sp. RL09-050-HVF-A]